MSGSYYGFTPAGTLTGNTYQPAGSYAVPITLSSSAYIGQSQSLFSQPTSIKQVSSSGYSGVGGSGHQSFLPGSTPRAAGLPTGTSAVSALKSVPTTPAASANVGGSGGAYVGYDAAVYAAATSYLQSKVTGQSQGWVKRGGYSSGSGTFPRKGGGPAPTRAALNQLHYCDVCKISCAGAQAYEAHLSGQKHKKREVQMTAGGGSMPPMASGKAPSFRCELCQVTCSSQDTYNAHIRGQKHIRAEKLHRALGKAVPDATKPTVFGDLKKIVGVPKMEFVGGNTLHTTATGVAETSANSIGVSGGVTMSMADVSASSDVKPVGENYVETVRNEQNRSVYRCKLCNCEFNDNVAKDMHLKGRRHRMEYKKKVDPSLEVDMKVSPFYRGKNRAQDERLRRDLMKMRQEELYAMRTMYHAQMMQSMGAMSLTGGYATGTLYGSSAPQPLFPNAGGSGQSAGPRQETDDDRHIMMKHSHVYPTEAELTAVQRIVTNTEKALKAVSDALAEQSKIKAEAPVTEEENTKPKALQPVEEEDRLLKGVMRVGALAKGLLLKGNMNVQVVVLCSVKPTRTIMKQVQDMLVKEYEQTGEKYDVRPSPENACLFVSSTTEPKVNLTISLTSTVVREPPADASQKPDAPDVLDKQKCLDALAALRHAKWFQARCSNLQACLVVLRVMRDLCQRVPTWTPLTGWALELLVEKVLSSAGSPLSVADGFRRIFETVTSGILLPAGTGLLDPCEKEVADAVWNMNPQQREDITASAQHALRLIAFNQIHKVLGIDKLPPKGTVRKRPADEEDAADAEAANGKKDKKDGEQ